ncbi:MAG: symmetrical bis(5'-nucleosyl)-tetraphosphatase [Candidatus Nitrospinota bacterium M3_3B_026]
MGTYAIGDIQGRMGPLEKLLGKIGFNPAKDRLWLTGDLVNRGPDSAAVLRWAAGLGDRIISVMGNHDLRLIGVADGAMQARGSDTFGDVLAAPDRDELLDWLVRRPLLHREGRRVLAHAGLLPQWTAAEAERLAREAEGVLRSEGRPALLRELFDGGPKKWMDGLHGTDRLRVIINAMTRMRVITPDGEMDLEFSGPPGKAPPGKIHWRDAPGRKSAEDLIICGHWAAQGLVMKNDMYALDSGCVWGRLLTAVRLDDGRVFQEPCSPEP